MKVIITTILELRKKSAHVGKTQKEINKIRKVMESRCSMESMENKKNVKTQIAQTYYNLPSITSTGLVRNFDSMSEIRTLRYFINDLKSYYNANKTSLNKKIYKLLKIKEKKVVI